MDAHLSQAADLLCWRLLLDEFLTAFWPNLAATSAGVILGVPIALWVNRIVSGSARRAQNAAAKKQLLNACDVIEAVLSHNNSIISQYPNILNNEQLAWNLGVNTTTWNAVSQDFSSELTPPELRSRMSHHFGNVTTLMWLNEQYLKFNFSVDASMSSASIVKGSLRTHLISLCQVLTGEQVKLLEMISELRKLISK